MLQSIYIEMREARARLKRVARENAVLLRAICTPEEYVIYRAAVRSVINAKARRARKRDPEGMRKKVRLSRQRAVARDDDVVARMAMTDAQWNARNAKLGKTFLGD